MMYAVIYNIQNDYIISLNSSNFVVGICGTLLTTTPPLPVALITRRYNSTQQSLSSQTSIKGEGLFSVLFCLLMHDCTHNILAKKMAWIYNKWQSKGSDNTTRVVDNKVLQLHATQSEPLTRLNKWVLNHVWNQEWFVYCGERDLPGYYIIALLATSPRINCQLQPQGSDQH